MLLPASSAVQGRHASARIGSTSSHLSMQNSLHDWLRRLLRSKWGMVRTRRRQYLINRSVPFANIRYGLIRTHGPLIHERAIEKVERHIEDALKRGAQLVHGGSRLPGPGTFFAPTILSDVPHDALINTEETFGPLASLTKFETEEEVLKLANDVPVGLAGYFYSRDVGRVWRVAEALEVGMVGSNTGVISQAVIPFGGVKESGLGETFVMLPLRKIALMPFVLSIRSRGRTWY